MSTPPPSTATSLPEPGRPDGATACLRTVIDAVSDHVAVLDAQGVILMVNSPWQAYALASSQVAGQGMTRSHVGANYLEVAAQGNPESANGIRAVLSGQAPSFSLQYPCHTPGQQRWFNMRVTPLVLDGQRCAIVAHADVTPEALVKEAIRQGEQHFTNIANATPVMIWLAGTDSLCHWFNAGWLAFTGRTLVQEQGNGWAEGVHPQDLKRCVDHYLSHFQAHQPFQMAYRLKHHSGIYRWIHDSGMPRFDTNGSFLGYIGSCVDVHDVHTANERLASMTALVPGVVHQFVTSPDRGCHFTYLSQGIEALYGITAEAACQDPQVLTQCIVPEDRRERDAAIDHAARTLSPWQHEHRIRTPAGELKWVRSQATPQPQADGSVVWSGLLTDVTDHKALEQRLRQGANVFAHVQEAILITDAAHTIIDVNAAFTRITGYERHDVLGKTPHFLAADQQNDTLYPAIWQEVDSQGFWMGEVFNRSKSGQVFAVILNISAVKDASGQITHYVGVNTDITHLKTQQLLLERVAHFDALTQLPNRVLLADRLKQVIAQAQRNQRQVALCYLDLDGFKQVNDTLGHEAGDRVLKTVAQRITSMLRASDTAARIGGDEFVVLLSDLDSFEAVSPLLERLLRAIEQPMEIMDHHVRVGASMGVAMYPDNATEPDTLLRQADVAMYQAKEAGKNCYQLSQQRAELAPA